MKRARLADQIRELRQRSGKTVREAADGSGYSYQYLNALENNAPNANPTLDALDAITAQIGGEVTVWAAPAGTAGRLTEAMAVLSPGQVERALRFAELARDASADLLDGVILALEARTRR